jgi:hypothetical protein
MRSPRYAKPVAVVMGALLAALPAAAQELPQHFLGKRVRLGLGDPPDRILVGRVVDMDADSLIVEPDTGGSDVDVPNDSLAWIDLSRIESRAGKYAGKGALIGAAAVGIPLGIAFATRPSGDCRTDEWISGCGPLIFAGAVEIGLGAGIGAFVGARIGARHQSETWHTVWRAPRVGLSVMPVPRGWGASVSVRF